MRLIAQHSFPYKGQRLRVGDSFDADAKLARVLITIGRAKAPELAEEPAADKPRRSYRRRDMAAEG